MSDDITDIDVGYVPAAVATTALGSDAPIDVLDAALTTSPGGQAAMGGAPAGDPLGGQISVPAPRLMVVIANETDSHLVQQALDVAHGYQTGRPMVADANGAPTAAPNATLGVTITEWIDAAPPGYAAIGAWSVDSHTFLGVAVYGPKLCLTVRHSDLGLDLTIGVWTGVGLTPSGSAGLWLTPMGGAPKVSDVYDAIDASTVKSADPPYDTVHAMTASAATTTVSVQARLSMNRMTNLGVLLISVTPVPAGH